MNEAGRTAGRQRDGAGRSEKQRYEARPDGKVPLLLSERTAVFVDPPSLQPAADDAAAFEPEAIGDTPPIVWTFDLVHCRLVTVAALWRQLPAPRLPPDVRSFLTALQPQSPSPLNKPLTPAQELRMDWTHDRINAFAASDRAVLMGIMCGQSVRSIATVTQHLARRGYGQALSKSAVHRRYRTLTTLMAEIWNEAGEPIDDLTREAWITHTSKKQ